jgi:hypothetical protein
MQRVAAQIDNEFLAPLSDAALGLNQTVPSMDALLNQGFPGLGAGGLNPISAGFDIAGLLTHSIDITIGDWSLGLRNGVDPLTSIYARGWAGSLYSSGWTGNKWMTTYNVGELAKWGGGILFVASFGYELYEFLQGNVSGRDFAVNTGMGVLAFDPITLPISVGYFGIKTFYPGGWPAFIAIQGQQPDPSVDPVGP